MPVQTAFKEWSIIVDTLLRGDQILILRKGGIREGRAGFSVQAKSFWLFPTQFHEQRASVIESAQQRFDAMSAADPDHVTIRALAEVVDHRELTEWSQVEALAAEHVWREEVIRERYEWGQRKAIFALVVRVHRLNDPQQIPMCSRYAGCRSWVDLEAELPAPQASKPVLSASQFQARQESFQRILQP